MSCPDDLKATVGATLDCTMTTDRQNDGVNVTVSSVNGGTVNFDIVETVSKDDIAGEISTQLNQQFGHALDSSRARTTWRAPSVRRRAARSPTAIGRELMGTQHIRDIGFPVASRR